MDFFGLDGIQDEENQEKKLLSSVSTSLALATGLGIAEAVMLSLGSGTLMDIMGIPVVCQPYPIHFIILSLLILLIHVLKYLSFMSVYVFCMIFSLSHTLSLWLHILIDWFDYGFTCHLPLENIYNISVFKFCRIHQCVHLLSIFCL